MGILTPIFIECSKFVDLGRSPVQGALFCCFGTLNIHPL
jgi:hypothetical protein